MRALVGFLIVICPDINEVNSFYREILQSMRAFFSSLLPHFAFPLSPLNTFAAPSLRSAIGRAVTITSQSFRAFACKVAIPPNTLDAVSSGATPPPQSYGTFCSKNPETSLGCSSSDACSSRRGGGADKSHEAALRCSALQAALRHEEEQYRR